MHTPHISNEVLDMMISCVDLPKDLLNVALACKNFLHLTIPNHLYFRQLNTGIDNDPLFTLLVSRPLLVANVRHLTMPWSSDSRPLHQVIVDLMGDKPSPSSRYQISAQVPKAIAQMPNLEGFSWHDYLPTSRGSRGNAVYETFEAVANLCLNLKSIAFHQRHPVPEFEKGVECALVRCPLPEVQLPFLTTLALQISCTCDACQTETFYEQLLSLPNLSLQDVHLDFLRWRSRSTGLGLWDIFKTVTWPALTRLSVQGTHPYRDDIQGPVFAKFLKRHPKLKALALIDQELPAYPWRRPAEAWPLFPKDLPENLHYLYVDGMVPKQLQRKKFARLLYVNAMFRDKSIRALNRLPMLRYCNLSIRHRNVKKFVDLLPNVERMNLTICERSGYRTTVLTVSEIQFCLSQMGGLSKLTHLGSFLAMKFLNVRHRGNRLIKETAETIPSLTHLEIYQGEERVWVKIKRDAEGTYVDYRIIQKEDHCWGLFFIGFPRRPSDFRDHYLEY
ncbi:hypothetical protein M422DRAFT_239213 [Sphaerobolus stellatus SS14]|nr:hypothetical protein M422DRAFT_239213 [Sphaerobolus stellatus SS14]